MYEYYVDKLRSWTNCRTQYLLFNVMCKQDKFVQAPAQKWWGGRGVEGKEKQIFIGKYIRHNIHIFGIERDIFNNFGAHKLLLYPLRTSWTLHYCYCLHCGVLRDNRTTKSQKL